MLVGGQGICCSRWAGIFVALSWCFGFHTGAQPHACAGLRENNADFGSHRACARVEAQGGFVVCVVAALTVLVSSVATHLMHDDSTAVSSATCEMRAWKRCKASTKERPWADVVDARALDQRIVV